MTRFGIIGTGLIAEFHARAIQAIPGAELVACYNITAERSAEFGAQWDCAPYSNLDLFLEHDGMSAVSVCTPSGIHLDPGLAVLDAGLDLIVEKPLEITTERCDLLINRAKDRGRTLAGIFMARFSDGANTVKRAIDSGRFGRMTFASASVKWHRTQAYYDQSDWRGTWKIDGGGTLMNQSIHAVDLLQWFAGGVTDVFAYADTLAHERIEVEDVTTASLRFAGGALGSIMATTASWPGWSKRIELSGTDGSVVIEDGTIRKWDFRSEQDDDQSIREQIALAPESASGAGDPGAIDIEGHRRQILDFVEAVEGRRSPLVDGHEARKAVAIIETIYRSARSGKPEKVR